MAQASSPTLLFTALAGLFVGGAAQAQQSPYYLGGSLGQTHVSNIYRLPDSQVPNSDDVTTVSLLAGIDQPIGRQRLYADTAVRYNAYRRDSDLNNLGYTLNGGLDWAALDKLGGTLSLRSSRNLATYNASTGVDLIREKNIEDNYQLQFTTRYGLVGKLSLEGGLAHQERNYSAAAYRSLEYKQDSLSAGLVYRPSDALKLGLAGRYTDGEGFFRPDATTLLPSDYKRKNIDLTSAWTPSAASTVSARLSFSKIDNALAAQRDYSGVTGQLSWLWRPTAKLQFNTSVTRDTAQESAFSDGGVSSGDINRVGTGASLNANYSLTSKILFDAGLSYNQINRSGQLSGDDQTQGISFGVRWLPTRNSQLSCQYSRDKRDSDIVNYNYSANSFGCTAQLMLR